MQEKQNTFFVFSHMLPISCYYVNNMKKIEGKNILNTVRGFTLMELLIAIAIIGVLAVIGVSSSSSYLSSARDSRRKTDLENIRTALESYRSNNSSYPPTLSFLEGSPKYIQLPKDPKYTTTDYVYFPQESTVVAGTTYYGSYYIATYLEKGGSTCGLQPGSGAWQILPNSCKDSNGSLANCNYCLDPYGKR